MHEEGRAYRGANGNRKGIVRIFGTNRVNGMYVEMKQVMANQVKASMFLLAITLASKFYISGPSNFAACNIYINV